MATLHELLQIEGVIVAFEFDLGGKLLDFKAKVNMPPDTAEVTAQFCAAVSSVFNALATAYTRDAPMSWLPQRSWTYSGGGWTVAVGRRGEGHRGVFAETAKTDFRALQSALTERLDESQLVPWPWVE